MYGVVKPKKGMIVRAVEDGQVVPESGRRVRITKFWIRLINDGDVTVDYEKEVVAAPAPKNNKEEQK